jgi:serine/threonine-protein kinase
MALAVGDILEDKYQITGVLGEGGMGTVYEGLHRKIHRRVAIKVLKAGLSDSDDIVRRFEREAQAAGRIGSEHIVEVYDVGQLPSGQRFMILEYLDGESLADRLHRMGTLTPEGIFPIAVQLLDGLDAAHRAGIVHRDLKPANVFLVRDRRGYVDFVKILDFGISKFRFLGDGEAITTTGNIVGTPHYMAPEQTQASAQVDHRCDVYGAGAVLYRVLSGRPPYQGQTIHQVLVQLITEAPRPLVELVPGLDEAAAGIVHRALAREPAQRYPDAAAFAGVVHAWLEERGLGQAGLSSPSLVDRSFSASSLTSGSVPTPAAPVAPSGQPRPAAAPVWRAAGSEALAQTTPLGIDAGSLATPSPFQTGDLAASLGPSKRKVALVLALAATVLVALVAVFGSSGGDESDAAAAGSATLASSGMPVAPALAEPGPAVAASASQVAAPVASSVTAPGKPPALPPRGTPLPKATGAPPGPAPTSQPAPPEPTPAAPAPSVEPPRQIRTDL